MAKRQSSLEAWLSTKTARISDENESDNYEYSEMDYLSDNSSMSEADEAESSSDTVPRGCTALCCSIIDKAFQPIDKRTLSTLTIKKRNFQPQWYKQFPWVSICTTYKNAYCLYCRHAAKHNLISFSKMGKRPLLKQAFRTGEKL